MKYTHIMTAIGILFYTFSTHATTFTLKNGDTLTGTVVEEKNGIIVLQSDLFGTVRFDKKYIKPTAPKKTEKKKAWKKGLALGQTYITGNTESSKFSGTFTADNKQSAYETNLKAKITHGSSDNTMDEQTWYTMARHSRNTGERTFVSARLEMDHDYFSDIHWRAIPSVGGGLYLAQSDTFTCMLETGLALEYTEFRSTDDSKTEILASPRLLVKKQFSEKWSASFDSTMYQSLEHMGEYRLNSELTVAHPISQNFSLTFSVVNKYTAKPSDAATKKSDTSFISALNYAF